MSKKNAYGMTQEDKRIAFTVISLLLLCVFFFTGAVAWTNRTWMPVIEAAIIVGFVIGTLTFFAVAGKILWRIAKRLFP